MDISVSRVQKSWLNARINLLFYAAALMLSYFSRRIFLQVLGTQFVGFTGTVGNFLGFLNLAEMGTAMAVSFALYKPLLAGDKSQVAEIVSLTGYLYRRIGSIIAAAGALFSAFLPLIFPHPGFPMSVVFFAWYAFLSSSLLSYYLNYGQVLLDADQRNYIVTAWLQTAAILKVLTQIILLSRFNGGYYTWISIELAAGIVQSILLRRKIRQTYPYLHPPLKESRRALRHHPEITKSIRQLAIHKLSEFAFVSTKDFFIYLFTSLTMVAYYGNYVIILTRINQALLAVLTSMQAGIGHLIAENNMARTMSIFWEILALRYFTTGVFIFTTYHLIESFISLWLGKQYLLDGGTLLLIMANVFLVQTRDIVLSFVQGFGLFSDVWAPLVEGGLNISLSLLLGYFFGMNGVLTGSLISMFVIAFVWKPIFLFQSGFKQPVWMYWREVSKYWGLLALSWIAGSRMLSLIRWIEPERSYSSWILYSLLIGGLYSLLLFALLFPLRGMRHLTGRLFRKILSKV